MKFTYKKQAHTDRINVWYDGLFLGEIFTLLKENKNIDWPAIRADKSLRVKVSERFIVSYIPMVRIGNGPVANLNSYSTRDAAAAAILDFHRSTFEDVRE